MHSVCFSIRRHAAWAPGIGSPEAWQAWAKAPFVITSSEEPGLRAMPPMLRRRAGFLGKMALEVAYQCLDGAINIPTVFCSRHGEVARGVDLLTDLASQTPLSPTSFGLSVHNASAGLFSIARKDQANHLALAAGASSVEHAVIEACSLLADGAAMVQLVVYDTVLPPVFAGFEDCHEQPHAFAWLMAPAGTDTASDTIGLSWQADNTHSRPSLPQPAGLDILRFQLSGARRFERVANRRRWCWTRDVRDV